MMKKHLIEKEKGYVGPYQSGFLLLKESDVGWWREYQEFKTDAMEQFKIIFNDNTVSAAWIVTYRFNESGGWQD